MAMAGCYGLDLYCDNAKNDSGPYRGNGKGQDIDSLGHRWGEFPHQYTDELGSTCRAMARRDGWRIGRQGAPDLCPKCNKPPNVEVTGKPPCGVAGAR